MDLFTPIVSPDKFNSNFERILARKNPYNEAVVNRWAEGFIDRDGKFVREFQTTFNSSFWELYLHAALKEVGCAIDFSHQAPDFVVTAPAQFTIEATVSLNAEGSLPESHPYTSAMVPDDLNEFNRVAILRLANSISSKARKFTESYCTLPHVRGKPFVLAVAPFDQPFAYLQTYRAIEAALYRYYVDEEGFLRRGTDENLLGQEMMSVAKSADVSVPLGFFNDEKYAFISAVIFNASATWGKVRALCDDPDPKILFQAVRSDLTQPQHRVVEAWKADYRETLLDGLRIYHNPFASHPLDWSLFDRPGVYQGCFDLDTNERLYRGDGEHLVYRTLVTYYDPNVPAGSARAETGHHEASSSVQPSSPS